MGDGQGGEHDCQVCFNGVTLPMEHGPGGQIVTLPEGLNDRYDRGGLGGIAFKTADFQWEPSVSVGLCEVHLQHVRHRLNLPG